MPAGLICSATKKMVNLEELKIKGTKVSLQHLGHVFGTCKKIKKLDFHFQGKSWEDAHKVLLCENMDCIKEGFKKLSSLKMSTGFLDAEDYLNDPWFLIIQILS